MEEKINVSVENGIKELVVREGSAEIIHEPKIIKLSGTIDAPRKFIEKRKTAHKELGAHVLYSRDKMSIELVVDERDYFSSTVIGKLEFNPDFTEFGINKKKLFTIQELQSFLKMRKFHFADKDENMKIVTNLSRFKASVSTQLEQANDTRGNKTSNYEVKVDSALSLEFTLFMKIFKGQPAKKFKVEIAFDVRDKEVSIWLESSELEELVLSDRDSIIDYELEAFIDYVIIEQ